MNRADIIVGLGFGDEGKGSMVDYLCDSRKADLVVRYNGGSQAGHNVVTPDGKHHCFQQIGSGTFVGAKTLLSRYVLVNPARLCEEVEQLSHKLQSHALNNHYIDHRALIITPYHVAANQLKEAMRGNNRHGSCGHGIGETMAHSLDFPNEAVRAGDLLKPQLAERLERIRSRKLQEMIELGAPDNDSMALLRNEEYPKLLAQAMFEMSQEFNIIDTERANALIRNSNSVFEGAQGVLLDEWHGFHPYTTWSTTTAANAHALLNEAGFKGTRETIGVIRSYSTRHGAGPFVAEGGYKGYEGEHNVIGQWQGGFKTGWFDGVMLRYACLCLYGSGRLDSIATTHTDAFDRSPIPYCNRYESASLGELTLIGPQFRRDLKLQEFLTQTMLNSKKVKTGEFTKKRELWDFIESATGVPVKYDSCGPTRDPEHKWE